MKSTPILKPSRNSGFALVIALSLMAFVLLLLLSMSTLVQVESQSANIQLQRLEAEQAALLGLNVALGELQKTAGPDQRVTADANINDANIQRPHVLGVWNSDNKKNSEPGSISYGSGKPSGFLQWLVSAEDTDKTTLSYPATPLANPDAPYLVYEGSVNFNDPKNFVQAEALSIEDASSPATKRYAWAVFDESQKANATQINPEISSNAQRVAALSMPGVLGYESISTLNSFFSPLEFNSLSNSEQAEELDKFQKVSHLNSLAFLGTGADFDPIEANAFHILSTSSKNLVVDVVNGGFKKDLSLLFENPTLPPEYVNRHLYSESDTPLEAAPTRFADAEPMPSPDPKWSLLKSHYDLYKKVTDSGGNWGIDASEVERSDATGYFDEQQMLPIVSNAQYIFSTQAKFDKGSWPALLMLWQDIVVTLWNPYDVELRVTEGMEFEFYRFPLELEFFIAPGGLGFGQSVTNEPIHLADMFNPNANRTGVTNIQDILPYRARIIEPFVLRPGEYLVFGPDSNSMNFENRNYSQGIELTNKWDQEGGGFTEVLIGARVQGTTHVGLAGHPTKGSGGNSKFIELQDGDRVSVRVSSGRSPRSGYGSTPTIPELNDTEVASYLKVYQGFGTSRFPISNVDAFKTELNRDRTLVGAIEFDLTDDELTDYLPTIEPDAMRQWTVNLANLEPRNKETGRFKEPFLIASLRLKTEQDSRAPDLNPNTTPIWLHNGLANPYFTNGIDGDQNVDFKALQYELTWEPMTDWSSIPKVEINPSTGQGYGAIGVDSAAGVNYAPFMQVPLVPATSLSQFSHAHLNSGGQAPFTTQIIGNSFASPLIPLDQKQVPAFADTIGDLLDHSYMANNSLFDGYFLSTAVDETLIPLPSSGRSLSKVISDFFSGTQSLINPNFVPVSGSTPSISAADYDTFAQHLYNKGAFNVNSTSVEAWALFLASGTKEALPMFNLLSGSSSITTASDSNDVPIGRFAPLLGDEVPGSSDDQTRWSGHRRLTAAQIKTLAEEIVDQVRARGPFQSVAEFVNRQLSTNAALANAGALETAIQEVELNTEHGVEAPKNNQELASTGSARSSDGAATQIIQADLLNRLAPSITVRGDTFKIRAYGDSTIGNSTVKVWCEAVVQREPEFVDDSQAPTASTSSLNPTNQDFGRRFKIISIRWLEPSEV